MSDGQASNFLIFTCKFFGFADWAIRRAMCSLHLQSIGVRCRPPSQVGVGLAVMTKGSKLMRVISLLLVNRAN